jgi:hypothetical protein
VIRLIVVVIALTRCAQLVVSGLLGSRGLAVAVRTTDSPGTIRCHLVVHIVIIELGDLGD